jgi:hypothetical protein
MTTKKFTVTHYHGIGECPKVILLDKKDGIFENQFDTITELENHLGSDAIIYFVADANENRIDELNNWNTNTKFDYKKLESFLKIN